MNNNYNNATKLLLHITTVLSSFPVVFMLLSPQHYEVVYKKGNGSLRKFTAGSQKDMSKTLNTL